MTELQQFGRYQILAELGCGGFATVYRALDTFLEREVALKILKPGWTDDPQVLQRFMQEAYAAARLDNPSIVTIYDIGNIENRLFIAMKLLPGQSLDKLIELRGRLTWLQSLEILRQVADALDYAHTHGLIHCDIKPSNIIVDENNRTTLTDFGLVRGAERASVSTYGADNVIGTPEYIAPEIWEGQPATKASDIYAVACVFFEMTTGQVLFAADNGAAVMRKHLLEGAEFPASWPSDVPDHIVLVLQRALAHDPSQRPITVNEFFIALLGHAQSQPSSQPAIIQSQQQPSIEKIASKTQDRGEPKIQDEQKREIHQRLLTEAYRSDRVELVSTRPMQKMSRPDLIVALGIVAAVVLFLTLKPVLSPPPVTIPTYSSQAVITASQTPQPTEMPTTVPTVIPKPTNTPTHIPPTIDSSLGIGSTRIATDSMILLYVPAGEFKMGADYSDTQAESDQRPQHTVYLDAFWIDQTEVTNAMFKKFIDATNYRTDAERLSSGYIWDKVSNTMTATKGVDWQHPRGANSNLLGRQEHPVVQVSWNDARAYCLWAGRSLPTEAQWEKAARGTDGRLYPWGNAGPDSGLLNFYQNVQDTTPAGSYPNGGSPYGALDMAGNVWEWVADKYDEHYYANSPSRNPTGPITASFPILRGGSWYVDAPSVHASYRLYQYPDQRDFGVGFRCAIRVSQ